MSKLDIVVAQGPWDPEVWRQAFEHKSNGRKVYMWPADGNELRTDSYVVCTWKADPAVFGHSVPPRAVFSLGAGVDHLLPLKDRPEIQISRIRDPDLTMRMVEYVTFATLYLHRKIRGYEASQGRQEWAPVIQAAASSVNVGIMGVGVLGKACGEVLKQIGFKVAGWTRTRPAQSEFPIFSGPCELGDFLSRTDILISLLPNTQETAGMIGKEIFNSLARSPAADGPYFVNAGRGEAVRQGDLITALHDGTLAGAVLDVFELEPLPANNALWSLPNVLITPHVAADSDPAVVVEQIMRDVERIEAGLSVESPVDLSRGY